MQTITLAAPAKINLYLEVLGRDAEGFHMLETVFQTLDFADQIHIARSDQPGTRLVIDNADLPTGPDNLAYAAVESARAEAGIDLGGIEITLSTSLPVAAWVVDRVTPRPSCGVWPSSSLTAGQPISCI